MGFERPTGKPAKDFLETFLYNSSSFSLPSIKNRIKDTPKKKRSNLSLTAEFISVYKYMFYEMYRTRWKKNRGYQEVCFLSFPTIAKWARVSKENVKDAIYYGVTVGILKVISAEPRKKGMYAPGHLCDKSYQQISSTGENLRCPTPQIGELSGVSDTPV